MATLNITSDQLRAYATQAAQAAPAIAAGLKVGLRSAAEMVAVEARSRSRWSERIPGSIRTTTRLASARVTAGGPKAPEAAPLNNRGRGGTFRHPVFGDPSVWVDQEARPFLQPALGAKADAVADAIANGVEQGLLEVLG